MQTAVINPKTREDVEQFHSLLRVRNKGRLNVAIKHGDSTIAKLRPNEWWQAVGADNLTANSEADLHLEIVEWVMPV